MDMLQSGRTLVSWPDLQSRLLVVLAMALMFLLLVLPTLAGGDVDGGAHRFDLGLFTLRATDQTVYPQYAEPMPAKAGRDPAAPDSLALPLSVDVQAPAYGSSDLETGLNVFVSMPDGCYRSRIKVGHIDDFTHRLTPILLAGDKDCPGFSRYDHQVVSLGKLLPGRHEIVVEHTMKPSERKTIFVTDRDLSEPNRHQSHQFGG